MEETILYVVLLLLAILVMLSLGLVIILYSKFNKLKVQQKYIEDKFENETLEELFTKMFAQNEEIARELKNQKEKIVILEELQKSNFDRVNVVRYNASRNVGAKMSYSVGFSNEAGDGLVITGLHYNDNVNIYIKKVVEGVSDIPLSKEEETALERTKVNINQ